MADDLPHSVFITSIDGITIDIADPVSNQNRIHRQDVYNNLGEQLNLLYDDIQAGVFGDAARTGRFATYLKDLKDQWPVTKIQ
jgi:hypothetical protein